MDFPCIHNYIDFDPFYRNSIFRQELQLLFAGWDSEMPIFKTNTADTSREGYMFHCVTDGCGYYQTENSIYTLTAGNIFLCRPGETAFYWPDETTPWKYVFFCLNGNMILQLLEDTLFQNHVSVVKTDVSGFFREIYGICQAAENQVYSLDHLASETAIRLLRMISARQSDSLPLSQTQRHWQDVQRYIHQNMNVSFTASDIAKALYIDHSYLSRISKAQTGLSIREYLLRFRLERAERYLRTSHLPIGEISTTVGFDHYPTFYRAFLLLYGCSPQKYRSNLLSSASTKNLYP